jgi:sarcosine oxidase
MEPPAAPKPTSAPGEHYDVIIAGVGAMGSAAAYHLARRGQRVLALERYGVPNTLGSSHGITRIIRLAYYEDPSYVALLQRAYVLWRELETLAGERLLIQTGSIDASVEDAWVFAGSVRSCREHDLPHEVLDATQLGERFPGYRLPADVMACYQPDGGFLLPERCVVAHARAAMASGADVRGHEPVLAWAPAGDGVEVTTPRDRYRADRLVLSAGAWIGELVGQLEGRAVPERQVLGWFAPHRPARFQPATFPVFNLETDLGRYYGFPEHGIPGFKLGRYHHRREQGRPQELRRPPDAADEALLREAVAAYFPDAAGPTLTLETCLFTNTPDEHFVIDLLPAHPQVVVASPCSGHGFKFSSVVGEILADLAVNGTTTHDLSRFSLDRLMA